MVKTILLSKLTHLFISLPTPDCHTIKSLEKLFFKFIWGSGKDRVARCQLIQDYCLGGLKMVHLESFIRSMKLSWIRRMLITNSPWINLYHSILPGKLEPLLGFGNEYAKKLIKQIKNSFWKEVILELNNFRSLFDHEKSEMLHHSIWYNSKICIGGNIVFYKRWYDRGVHCISDLVNGEGRLMNYIEFCEIYFTPMITVFQGLRNAILESYNWLRDIDVTVIRPFCPKYIRCIVGNGKGASRIYDVIIKTLHKEQKYTLRWTEEFDLEVNNAWWSRVNSIVKLPMETRLRWFHYRIVHRIIATNTFLCKIGIVDSPLCTFCSILPESIIHLFWECRVVSQVIQEALSWLSDILERHITLFDRDFILGFSSDTEKLLNYLFILLKNYVYKQRAKNFAPSIGGYKKEVEICFNIEEYTHKKNLQVGIFKKKWKQLYELYRPENV